MTLIADITNPRIRVYNSGNNSERYSQLLISKYSTGIQRYNVMEVELEDIEPGEVFIIEAHVEITTPYNTNIEVTGKLTYELYSGGNTGWDISEENGTNVDLDQHHMIYRATGSFVASTAYTKRHVALVMYAAQDDHQNFSALNIEPDYGRMIITRISP